MESARPSPTHTHTIDFPLTSFASAVLNFFPYFQKWRFYFLYNTSNNVIIAIESVPFFPLLILTREVLSQSFLYNNICRQSHRQQQQQHTHSLGSLRRCFWSINIVGFSLSSLIWPDLSEPLASLSTLWIN